MNTIARPCSSAAAITSASFTEPARLHDGRRAGGGERVEAVAEREEGVGGDDAARARRPPAFITATFTASTRLIWPAPTARVASGPA